MTTTRTARAPDGTRIAYDVTGHGPSVVFLHGITFDRRTWDRITPAIAARGFQCVRIDTRGHGESERASDYGGTSLASDVLAVIAELGIERPALVGHSLGGYVATLVAAAIPTRSVVNIDQVVALGAMKPMLDSVAEPVRDPARFGPTMNALLDSLIGSRLSADVIRELAAYRSRMVQEVAAGVWAPLFDRTAEALELESTVTCRKIAAPYLALHGSDPGDGYVAWLRERVPQAEIEVWNDYGHYPHLVDPARFVARISTLL